MRGSLCNVGFPGVLQSSGCDARRLIMISADVITVFVEWGGGAGGSQRESVAFFLLTIGGEVKWAVEFLRQI